MQILVERETGTRTAYVFNQRDMATFLRVLLWTAVVLAPGGVLLAPVLAAHEMRRRSAARS